MAFLPTHTQHPVASLMDYEDVLGSLDWTDHLRTDRLTFSRGKALIAAHCLPSLLCLV